MNIKELNELMAHSAQDAINYAQKVHDKTITLCQQDLTMVEMILIKLSLEHIEQPINNEQLFTICSIFGAFIGEVYKKNIGGEWFMDESDQDAPYIVLNYAGKSFPFASMCYEKIVKTPEVNIAKYYELAVEGVTQ